MAKSNSINPHLLFGAAVVLLAGGSLFPSFPIIPFFALAPLIAITDHANDDNIWNKLELIGLAIIVGILAWFDFDLANVVRAILLGIGFTLAFGAYTFSRSKLSGRFGKLPLILFWLTIEYLLLKFFASTRVFFLADTVYDAPHWLRWTSLTGYLGASFWVLVANVLLYQGLLQNGVRLLYLAAFVIVIVGPILYSYSAHSDYIARLDMLFLYMDGKSSNEVYDQRGEWIPRTATWVSGLVLLSAFIKGRTKKK